MATIKWTTYCLTVASKLALIDFRYIALTQAFLLRVAPLLVATTKYWPIPFSIQTTAMIKTIR